MMFNMKDTSVHVGVFSEGPAGSDSASLGKSVCSLLPRLPSAHSPEHLEVGHKESI